MHELTKLKELNSKTTNASIFSNLGESLLSKHKWYSKTNSKSYDNIIAASKDVSEDDPKSYLHLRNLCAVYLKEHEGFRFSSVGRDRKRAVQEMYHYAQQQYYKKLQKAVAQQYDKTPLKAASNSSNPIQKFLLSDPVYAYLRKTSISDDKFTRLKQYSIIISLFSSAIDECDKHQQTLFFNNSNINITKKKLEENLSCFLDDEIYASIFTGNLDGCKNWQDVLSKNSHRISQDVLSKKSHRISIEDLHKKEEIVQNNILNLLEEAKPQSASIPNDDSNTSSASSVSSSKNALLTSLKNFSGENLSEKTNLFLPSVQRLIYDPPYTHLCFLQFLQLLIRYLKEDFSNAKLSSTIELLAICNKLLALYTKPKNSP